jgi:uncharacterized protein
MHESVSRRTADIAALCHRVGVRRLSVFGSATRDDFDGVTSDVDFVVEFEGGPQFDYFDAYFSLSEGLESILGRPVDLIARQSMKNPYFKERVESTSELIYAA